MQRPDIVAWGCNVAQRCHTNVWPALRAARVKKIQEKDNKMKNGCYSMHIAIVNSLRDKAKERSNFYNMTSSVFADLFGFFLV